jgi:predicted permease
MQGLLPSRRAALEREMKEELESLAAMAEPGELGNLTRAAEEARPVWNWTWLDQLYRDLQYALRAMRHNRGFTSTAILSLALGIGANTAIFSLIDALMLRWIPARDPQELVQLKMRTGNSTRAGESFSWAIVTALAEQRDIFAGVGGFSAARFDVGPRGSTVHVPGAWVTGDYYETLGLNPAAGRLLTREDDQSGAPLVAVISDGYWERQFARNLDAIGRSIPVNGIPVTITGVSPRGFTGTNVGSIADITLPAASLPRLMPSMATILKPGNFWLVTLARPQRNLSVAQAQARLAIVWPQISEQVISKDWNPARRKEMAASTFELAPGGTGYSYLRVLFRKPLLVLMAVAGLVLLIACANIASLLLARATCRQREISVRLAIGASRGRIVRQLLTESTLLSSIGAALGILVAWLTSRLLVDILSTGPRQVVLDLAPNWHVLCFNIVAAAATGVLFGLAPAFQATVAAPSPAMQGDARMTHSRSRLLPALISVQVALSLVLLVGAGLFARTLQNLVTIDPGFRREGLFLVDVDGRDLGYRDARLASFYKDLVERIQRVPGVTSASISSHTPFNGSTWSEAVVPKGEVLPEKDNALFIAAGPNFFSTMQTPLYSGREFDSRDQGSFNVAIVNQTFAARYFNGRTAVGEYLSATVTRPPSDLQIIGVVRDAVTTSLRSAPRPIVYVPFFQRAPGEGTLEIRASGSLSQIAGAIRVELQPSFPNRPVEVRPLTGQMERTLVQERLMANLAGGFGALGLFLACVGLYGLLDYSVARRAREIGVRMALGAQKKGIVWMVLKSACLPVALGMTLGLPVAWLASSWVSSMLFGLTATDPVVLAAAMFVLTASGLMAGYLPARRGAQVNPMSALRHE